MVNHARGEVAITLDGKTYALCPTMRFIAEVEERYGSLIGLLQRFSLNNWKVAEVAGILEVALADEERLTARDIAEAVHEAGPAHLLEPVMTLCGNALTGGKPLGEDEEADPGNEDGAAVAETTGPAP